MGKTAIDEQHPQFGGIYVGDITIDSVKEAVESSDFTLYVGSLKSDFNTGSFSWHIVPENTVELHSDMTVVQVRAYRSHRLLLKLRKCVLAVRTVSGCRLPEPLTQIDTRNGKGSGTEGQRPASRHPAECWLVESASIQR